MTVERSGVNYVFTESGAVLITATAPCVNVLATVATCPVAGIDNIDVSLLDMNDTASYDASIVAPIEEVGFDGGPGNDTLTGAGPTDGYFVGRDGNDTITGGEGVEGIDCKVKIIAKKGKKTLAKGSGKVKSGKTGKVPLKLTKAGKKAKGKKLKTKATTKLTDATGAKVSTSRKLVLKR
ncbi:MAG: hypothetical protein JJE10_06605 [Thermoleophilia bacterium]|nr:hypothetical protein [Thermoleophilia bacterium]